MLTNGSYYLNWDQIEFNRTGPSQVHEWLGSFNNLRKMHLVWLNLFRPQNLPVLVIFGFPEKKTFDPALLSNFFSMSTHFCWLLQCELPNSVDNQISAFSFHFSGVLTPLCWFYSRRCYLIHFGKHKSTWVLTACTAHSCHLLGSFYTISKVSKYGQTTDTYCFMSSWSLKVCQYILWKERWKIERLSNIIVFQAKIGLLLFRLLVASQTIKY